MKKILSLNLFLFYFGVVYVFLPGASEAYASNFNVGQKILPVKFVYLDNKGKIKKIWSNVEKKDDVYVVKFFDAKKNQEIEPRKELVAAFKKQLSRTNIDQASELVEFVDKGEYIEEIITAA